VYARVGTVASGASPSSDAAHSGAIAASGVVVERMWRDAREILG
jgi:hypothetical protein